MLSALCPDCLQKMYGLISQAPCTITICDGCGQMKSCHEIDPKELEHPLRNAQPAVAIRVPPKVLPGIPAASALGSPDAAALSELGYTSVQSELDNMRSSHTLERFWQCTADVAGILVGTGGAILANVIEGGSLIAKRIRS